MNELTIEIFLDSEGNYQYNIYDRLGDIEGDSLDGGACTSTMENAIEMATEQALGILAHREELEDNKCPSCGKISDVLGRCACCNKDAYK